MSRVVTSVLALAAFAAVAPALAQRKELTFVAGGTLSWANGNNLAEVDKRPGFVAGLSLRLPRTPQFSLQTDLLVIQRRMLGRRAASSLPPLQSGPLTDAANLLYIELPILLRFQRGYSSVRPVRPWLVLGPYLGVRLDCSREVSETSGNTRHTDCSVPGGNFTVGSETYLPAVYQEVDVGFLGGIGVEVHRFALGARFERSVRNLVEPGGGVRTSPFDTSRLWAMTLSLEYLVRVL